MQYKRIAVDTSKSVFTLHGVDEFDQAVLRGDYSRSKFKNFFQKQSPTEVVMEACGGAHHWARTLLEMGHRVKLIPPQYVKACCLMVLDRAKRYRIIPTFLFRSIHRKPSPRRFQQAPSGAIFMRSVL